MDEFIKEKDKQLIREVKEGEYENLVKMMGYLGAVREKTAGYDNMFDPIKHKIELLKTYGQEVPDDVYDKLQVKNANLKLIKKKYIKKKNNFIAFTRKMDKYQEAGNAGQTTSRTTSNKRGG